MPKTTTSTSQDRRTLSTMAESTELSSHKSGGSKDTPAVEAFECGTSLAEAEHRPFDGHGDRAGRSSQATDASTSSSSSSVDALRESFAADIVSSVSDSPIEVFTSPFEVPASIRTASSDKFLQVPLVYCDQTASNRPVQSVEDYMRKVCLPLYGNTHTNTSITGSQSTAFCAEARQIVAEATNAKITGKASLDVVLFA